MPKLTFEESKDATPIAFVRGGDYDGECVFLTMEDTKSSKKMPIGEINASKYAKDLKGLSQREKVCLFNKYSEAVSKNVSPESFLGSEKEKVLYQRIIDDRKDSEKTEIILPHDSSFHICPSVMPNKRQVYYIAGASGSGKSYIARDIASSYKKLFPEREVYLVSKLTEDETLDKVKPKRLNVDTFLEDYPSIEEFRDCMVIFDDIDCFDTKQLKVIHQLIDDIAITGRHTNTTLLFLTHYITNYKKTRLILNETTHFVLYPQSTSYNQLKYILCNYVGMDSEDVKSLRSLGRWVCVSKHFPQYLLSEHKVKLLHTE